MKTNLPAISFWSIMKKYIPLGDNVIVEKHDSGEQTVGGIILASAKDSVDEAKVVSIGPRVSTVAVGDVCIVNWNEASKIANNVYRVSIGSIVAIVQ